MDNKARAGSAAVLIVLLTILLLAVPPAAALVNPAAGYCTALNYTYTTVTGPDGMTGYCTLPGGQKVEAWRFLQGKEGTQYGYCAKQGYALETTTDAKTCSVFMTDSCAVCVLPDGTKTEVTKLMGLSFRERLCSNGKCCDPKTDTTCSFTDRQPPVMQYLPILVIILVIAAGIIVILFTRGRKETASERE